MNKEPLIKLERVKKSFLVDQQEFQTLHDINLDINYGDSLSIMGPSGAGKSTLLNIIGLLDRPTHGIVKFKGQDTNNLNDKERSVIRCSSIGFIFQSFYLLPHLDVFENVFLPLQYSGHIRDGDNKVRESLLKVGMLHRINHKPNELSGGEMQRVAIARSLVNSPDLILADEPTGSLDSKNTKNILDLFEEIKEQGVAIITVTHDPDVGLASSIKLYCKDGQLSYA